jgi:hypothetical protein
MIADSPSIARHEAATIRYVIQGRALSGAILWGANLRDANLRAANLHMADLSGANLSGRDLREADLRECVLNGTILANVYLGQTQGLATIQHRGPSVVDWGTLRKSWPLPEGFLRGCGLPDELITYLPSLLATSPIQYYDVFISYSSKDEAFAGRLHAGLQANNVRCWFAPEDLPIGAKIRPGIDEAIRLHDKLLLILSEHSVSSQWVEQEVETALRKERETDQIVLFPVRLDDAVFTSSAGWSALLYNTRNIGDFRDWKNHDAYSHEFQRVLRDLKKEITTPTP